MLNDVISSEQGPHEFRRLVQRFFLHINKELYSIDGPNDGQSDLIHIDNYDRVFTIQSKWRRNLDKAAPSGIYDEMLEARKNYSAHVSIGVTNTFFDQRTQKRHNSNDTSLHLLDFNDLKKMQSQPEFRKRLKTNRLRDYQTKAFKNIIRDLDLNRRALLYMATGLGKTKVASRIIRLTLRRNPKSKILVLAHMKDLLDQFQVSVWKDISFDIQTQKIDSENSPESLDGITFSTYQSIGKYLDRYEPDLIIIDECHHVGDSNNYADIIEYNTDIPILGLTATPWRGDAYNIEDTFGRPSYTISLSEGMAAEYLAPVNYKIYQDNIDWDIVPEISKYDYSIKDLNKKLFVQQRDEKILEELNLNWNNVKKPKCIIFCQSILHCEEMIQKVQKFKKWENSRIIHSGMKRLERLKALTEFRKNTCPILIAVDILNEGIDVPNVNLICFAKVTHSRKVFLQQLGRGLRTHQDKEAVIVLDFVADIRRIAAISDIEQRIKNKEKEHLRHHNKIDFIDKKAEKLMNEWIKDLSELDGKNDSYRFEYPEI
jgi:superfamily II DNA or RNA helicase